ncbi:glycine oxidase [Halopseudomonas litoralis]|uniref:Glycine oxidase n=1 Tax=Halopseudomonas litoralis TaxID=797277 RepID=A0A1H1U4Y9_9GAMM|nr:glycine oxidase ThiO [Halopseudomonas litoralis]SDS67540.1 glycine oxidase [Halopseudomonas litoralis]
MQHVVIVGGGVIGCLSALNLLDAGARVTLIERRQIGREASWAGGGIVSPLYPWRYSQAVSALSDFSQNFYPGLGRRLAERTGIDPQVTPCGLLWLDSDEQADALAWAERQDKPLRSVEADFIYQQVPVLAEGYDSALWQADLANVRNPRLMAALRDYLTTIPECRVLEETPDARLLVEHGRVTGVDCAGDILRADAVVLAAGAWSGDCLATLGLALPVEPVKGQMLLYKADPNWLQSMVLHAGRYAIPRCDGHILIGSTLEHEGFDKTTTEVALSSLRASAVQLLPALAEQEPVMQWAGLRPGSPEGVPYIGQVPDYPGLWLNTGHYRNGLVLAPASCRLLADLMLGRRPIVDPAPYRIEGRVQRR